MAIDTPLKRRSAAHVSGRHGPGVTPDATQPQVWRQTAGYGYAGILADAPSIVFTSPPLLGTFVFKSRIAEQVHQPSLASLAHKPQLIKTTVEGAN